MAYNHQRNVDIYESRHGKGSYNSLMSSARDIGRLKVEAKFAKSDYLDGLRKAQALAKKQQAEAEKAAKKLQEEADKVKASTGDPSQKVLNSAKGLGTGTVSYADKMLRLHDPVMAQQYAQQKADEQRKKANKTPSDNPRKKFDPYAPNPYLDPSVQNFSNQQTKLDDFYKKLNKNTETRDKADRRKGESFLKSRPELAKDYAKIGGTKTFPTQKDYDEQVLIKERMDKLKSKKTDKKVGIFDRIKKSEIGQSAIAAEQFFNIFDKTGGKEAVDKFLHHKQSKTAKAVARGANRAVDSASLGAMSNLDKRVNKREPYYNSARKFGEGGGTDMLTSGLGYLVPGVGITKGARALGIGAKSATGLARFGQLAKEGAIVGGALGGGEVGIREALNGKDYSAGDDIKHIALNAGLGAIGDPLLHGVGRVAGKGIGKLIKGDVPSYTGRPSESVVDSLRPPQRQSLGTQSGELFDRLQAIRKPMNEPMNPMRETAATSERIAPRYENITAGQPDIVPMPVNHELPYKPGDPLPDTMNHIGTKTKHEVPSLSNLKEKTYIKTVDNLHKLNQFDREVEKVLGRDLKPSESSYTLGLNSRGTDQISKQILVNKMVNKSGEVIGPSLKEITMKVPKGKLKTFEDYLVNKHAITRMDRGEKVFPDEMKMNVAKSEAKVKEYEAQNPEFKQLSEEYYKYNDQLGKSWLVDNGILSEKQWKQYREANPHYVPNYRIFSDIEKGRFMGGAKKGFSNQSNPIKKAVGSQRKIVSPIESTIEHTDKYVKTAKRNEVMQTVIQNLQKDPEAFKGWAEIVPTKDTPQDIMETLQRDGVDGVLERFNEGFNQKPDLTKGNIVFGIVDGKKVHVKVNDPQFLDAITNLSPQGQQFIIKGIGQLTRVMKNLTTGINPIFSLTRNIFRDIPTAYTNSKTTHNPFMFSKDLVQSVVSVIKNDELYQSFKSVGGGHSSPVSSDVKLLDQSKRSILPSKGIKPILGKGLGAVENFNNAVESAPRLAEFKRITKNDSSYDAKMKGLYEANDVTVNFNKYGNTAKEADAIIPYLNAALQGLDKSVRSVKDQPIKFLIKGFSSVTIPAIALYAINHNNPAYNQLSDYIKDNNFLIPNGDGTFTKIPKPRELGVVFGSDVERTLRMWNEKDPGAFSTFAETVMTNFMPPKRTVLAPFGDVRANKNFMGAPIVPNDLKGLSPQYQYDSKTSEVAKGLGRITKKSPKQIQYIGKSYLGVLGELGIPATTKNATIKDTLKQKVTADPVFSNDNAQKFYDLKTKLDSASQDYKRQGIKSKDLNEPLRLEMNRKSLEMGKVRKQIKSIQNNSELTRTQKQDQTRKLQQFLNKLSQIPKQAR